MVAIIYYQHIYTYICYRAGFGDDLKGMGVGEGVRGVGKNLSKKLFAGV